LFLSSTRWRCMAFWCLRASIASRMYAFVVEDMPKEEYKLQYPKSELAACHGMKRRSCEGWVGSETHVRIAEYWYVEERR
jgi:hypothetical protein